MIVSFEQRIGDLAGRISPSAIHKRLSWRLLDQYGIHRSSTSPTKSWQTSSSSLLSCSWQAESSSEHIVAILLAQRKLLKAIHTMISVCVVNGLSGDDDELLYQDPTYYTEVMKTVSLIAKIITVPAHMTHTTSKHTCQNLSRSAVRGKRIREHKSKPTKT